MMLRDLLAESSESEVRSYGDSTTAILADLGIKKHSNEEIAVLQSVLTQLSGLYAVMPTKMQGSFLEMGSQFDIDPEFNMMNEMSSDMEKENYYAPKKFAVMSEMQADPAAAAATPTDEQLDAVETGLKEDRTTYGEGYVDYESTTNERTDVGTDHVDDKTDDMEMRGLDAGERTGYAALQDQILGMLDELVAHLEESMQRMMDDEIAASAAFADWKILTENEEVVLQGDRDREVAAVADFTVSIDEQNGLLATCSQQRTAQELNTNQACGAHATAEAAFNRKKDNKIQEINLFGEVKAKYQRMASELDAGMRQRVNEQ